MTKVISAKSNKIFLEIIIALFMVCIFCFSSTAGHPLKKFNLNDDKENIFDDGSCISLFTDITFYGGKPVNGYGISFEPKINEYLSLNYKFALNYRGSDEFSVHGNPGTVVAPYWLSTINPDDTNKTGQIVLAVISLLIPEGVNFKYKPDGFSKIIFAGYFNPLGIDYARRRPEMDRTIYMSGELGGKAYFIVQKNIFVCAFGGFRSIYSFGKVGFSVGIHAGMVLGGSSNSMKGKSGKSEKEVKPVFYEN